MAPPAGEARDIGPPRMALMHEQAADRARTAVEVLVTAPAREIAPRVVEGEREVPGGMGQIEADHAPPGVAEPCDLIQVEHLAGVILDPRQQDQRDGIALALDGLREVFPPQAKLTGPRPDHEQRRRRFQAMEADLGLDGVAIGGKGPVLDQDLVPFHRGSVEAHHHEVQIGGERPHHRHLVRLGADERRARLDQKLMVGHPGTRGLEMPAHAPALPDRQLLEDIGFRALGHEPEGVAAEIDLLPAILPPRDMKLITEARQRIRSVLGPGVFEARGFVSVIR